MKHHILVKWNELVDDKKKMAEEATTLFNKTKKIEGIHDVNIFLNCINRANRYDLMIVLDMDESALEIYDDCKYHHIWKNEYSKFIEKKAIFDMP